MNTTIRELKYSDRLKLSGMIKKLSEKIEDDTLLKLVSSSDNKTASETDNSDTSYIKIAIKLFNLLVEFLEEDVSIWFADLCNVDIDEFKNKAPFDIEIVILNQLLEEKGKIKSFLAGASRLYSTIIGLKNRLSIMSD